MFNSYVTNYQRVSASFLVSDRQTFLWLFDWIDLRVDSRVLTSWNWLISAKKNMLRWCIVEDYPFSYHYGPCKKTLWLCWLLSPLWPRSSELMSTSADFDTCSVEIYQNPHDKGDFVGPKSGFWSIGSPALTFSHRRGWFWSSTRGFLKSDMEFSVDVISNGLMVGDGWKSGFHHHCRHTMVN